MLLRDGRELGRDTADGQGKVRVEVDAQRRVEEDRDEAGPPRCLLRLGAPAAPLLLETQAGDDADDPPAPVAEVEERAGAADRFVIGVRRDVQDSRCHQGEDYARPRVSSPEIFAEHSLQITLNRIL